MPPVPPSPSSGSQRASTSDSAEDSSGSVTSGATPRSLVDARRIVDTLHEPLLVLGEGLSVRQVNPAFYQTFSTTPEETVGMSLYELGGGHFDRPRLRSALGALVEEGDPFEQLELDHVFEGLGRRVLQINGQKLISEKTKEENDSEKREDRILLAIDDITEQRRLEDKLRRHTKKLERSNADLEQFAYAASHDLQEPLRMVSSYLQLLERRYKEDLDETAQEFIDYAVDGASRMKALINGLLQYSRVGRKEGEFEEIRLDSVFDDVLDDLSRQIEELEGTATREKLPTVYGNRNQLRRVFQNLVENALKYHGEAPPRIYVSEGEIFEPEEDASATEKNLREENLDGLAHLVIRDQGPGIPSEAQEKIFHIFKQLDPHGTGREGSGMGLALCRKIVERHGGKIWVESEPGEGAAFHITLPRSQEKYDLSS